ncbi:MAG: hypothetical protein OXU36_14035 [Candidatus Poribacteria bacterium]|nr:hypothetical protein [Candidatus Poribacteria bacterium]
MMKKRKGLILFPTGLMILVISLLSIWLSGCGDSNEHAIFRSGDMITVYWVLEEENAEITNFELKNNILEFDIDTGDLHEKQTLPINSAKSHETLEIKGISRLDELAVFHIVVNPMRQSYHEFPGIEKSYMTFREREHLENTKPGDFTNAETFRAGDRITVFWHRPGKSEKNWHNWRKGYGSSNTMDKGGLPDNWVDRLSIKEVKPPEKVMLIGVGMTPEIYIAYFHVSATD